MSGFKDLKVWQRSKELAVLVYRLTQKGPFTHDYGFRDQIRRAAVSVPSNIAEGYGRNSTSDYIRFLRIASGSVYELQTQLEIAVNLRYIRHEDFVGLNKVSEEIGKMLSTLIKKIELSKR